MKRQLKTIGILLTAVLVFMAVSAEAQSRRTMTVNVPFQFEVAGETYEPGEYKIERLNPDKPSVLVLKGAEKKKPAVFLTQKLEAEEIVENPGVTFTQLDDAYFLSEIWTGGSKTGVEVLIGAKKREAEKLTSIKRQKVTLTARLH